MTTCVAGAHSKNLCIGGVIMYRHDSFCGRHVGLVLRRFELLVFTLSRTRELVFWKCSLQVAILKRTHSRETRVYKFQFANNLGGLELVELTKENICFFR